MRKIGYARVSTDAQLTQRQISALKEAGCNPILEEKASGADSGRPVLKRAIAGMQKGDLLVVVKLDRLARSLPHLLEVIETIRQKGAEFRSLNDPIDTSSPQGTFTLQIMGAVAQLERALIVERTKSGLASAKAEGRVGGNPGLRRKDPAAIAKISEARDKAYLEAIFENAHVWTRIVTKNRPDMSWEHCCRLLNATAKGADTWTVDRLRRAAKRFVKEGMLDKNVLNRSPRARIKDSPVVLVAAMCMEGLSIRDIQQRLKLLHVPTPRGKTTWQPSSIKMLIDRAISQGYFEK